MKVAAALSLLPLLAAARPWPSKISASKATTDSGAFGVMSLRSASPIHLQPVQASGQAFYIGGEPSTYCPDVVGAACPPGKETQFRGASALNTEVPGGQILYVQSTGAVGFTQAHSAAIPPGSTTAGFTYTPAAPGSQFGQWSFSGLGANGFMACPPTAAEGRYQVFANLRNATVPTGNVGDCLGFDPAAIAVTATNGTAAPAAWQYI